ncbi:MAG: type II toxin-antitoxin system HicB family antitoxin [bacterium]
MMEYKGYTGEVEYDDGAKIFHGRVIGIKGVITFEGESVAGLEQAFRESVEDYLEFCSELGQEPEKPFSGKFTVRIPPELHRRVSAAAQACGKSLNAWLE